MNTMRNKIMKGGFRCLLLLGSVVGIASCSDIMDTESDRMIIDPDLDAKTDSVYYINGMLRGLQQLADQYVLTGEFRGDLIEPNSYTLSDLRDLANFSADATNAYDSAYVYYRVINNCNYYIAHRDTTLLTGSIKVAIPEYAEALAIRAWTYMQLAKNYGTVPFTLNPITSIGEANSVSETKDLQGIADALLPGLLQYSGTAVPTFGNVDINAGTSNPGATKTVKTSQTMLPIDLVIADLYLETNRYEEAARYYFKYLCDNKLSERPSYISPYQLTGFSMRDLPNDMSINLFGFAWLAHFASVQPNNAVITYIPMAVNKQRGVISNLPEIFGYDYYSTNVDEDDRFLVERMATPSSPYIALANAQDYYYNPVGATDTLVKKVAIGDLRRYATWPTMTNQSDSTFTYLSKYMASNVYVYRLSMVYLRLAEALNRMGYPDAAFMILKDGICSDNVIRASVSGGMRNAYLRDTTITMLTNVIPFFFTANRAIFNEDASSTLAPQGIHSIGSGTPTGGVYSPYQYRTVINDKFSSLIEAGNNAPSLDLNNLSAADSLTFYSDYAIDAMEDIICDEMALESAGEGNRWGDLMRIATHKNASSPSLYGGNYGGTWLARKLSFKNPVKDLSQQANWYLPMK